MHVPVDEYVLYSYAISYTVYTISKILFYTCNVDECDQTQASKLRVEYGQFIKNDSEMKLLKPQLHKQ